MTYLFRALLLFPFLFLSISALTYNHDHSPIDVEKPWANTTPSVAKNAAVYMKVYNQGKSSDWLVGASIPASIAESVELHSTIVIDDMASMNHEKKGLLVPAEGILQLQPRGTHIMLMGLKKPLKNGDSFPINLIFKHNEVLRVEVVVTEKGLVTV